MYQMLNKSQQGILKLFDFFFKLFIIIGQLIIIWKSQLLNYTQFHKLELKKRVTNVSKRTVDRYFPSSIFKVLIKYEKKIQ